jgi:exonuclease VII small subunit
MAIIVPILTTFNDKGIKSAVREFQTATTAIQKFGATGKIFEGIGKGLTKNVTVPIIGVVGALGMMVKGAIEAEAAQSRLKQILLTTGGASSAQVDVLLKQAAALEKIGVVSKESIVTTQSQLATFDLQASTIAKLTPAILDYVTAEKGAMATADDFKSMTNGLAQALNGQFGALTRVGFVLDEDTKKKISNGTESERAAAIVEVLNSTYKDFNKSLAETPQGQIILLSREFSQLRDELGSAFIPIALQISKIIREQILPQLQRFVDRIKALSPETIALATKITFLVAAIGPLLIVIGKVIGAVKGFIVVFKALSLALLTNPIYLVIAGLTLLGIAIFRAWQTSNRFREGLAKLGNIIVGVAQGAINLFIKLINQFIKGFNTLVPVLKFFGADVEKLGEISEVSFAKISFGSVDAGKKITGLSEEASDLTSTFNSDLTPSIDDTTASLTRNASKSEKAKDGLKKLREEARKAAQTIVDNLEDSLRSAESKLDDARNAFENFKNSIKGVVAGVLNFGRAAEDGSFIENITNQAAQATVFADKVRKLIVGGLSERAIKQVLDAGFEAGSKIADEIIAGGTTMVQQVNALVDSVDFIANEVGVFGAQTFYQAGVSQGEALVAGIRAALENARAELKRIVDSLATGDPVAPKTTKTTKTTGKITTVLPPDTSGFGLNRFSRMAKGGIVLGPTNALIGEAGPEAVVPLSGANSAKLGTTYNIVVNAGIGTSGAQVGREIVDAIKKFEKTSGPVFASA